MIAKWFSDEFCEQSDHDHDKQRDQALERLRAPITGLLVSSLDGSGQHIGQDRLNSRLNSAQLLLGHVLDNPVVLSVPGQVSQLDPAGYPQADRVWIVFALVESDSVQWLEFTAGARRLRRLWGVDVGVVGPFGYAEV